MKDTRRDFIKKTLLLSGTAGLSTVLPESIKRAAAISPAPGSTYLDAEHVVILMQENRSFDHCFGTLKGVRGFNDPRAVRLPDKNLVWMQSNEKGETYLPFRFDIKNTKATWMGSVPHSRSSQVDANNLGKYDNWLPAKRVRNKKYAELPLTLGYYNREDIPFHYALADAFTVCDQNFSSGMTCTRPNRLFFWTGTIREKQNGDTKAHIRNEDESFGTEHWKTFPEQLEDNGVSWKFYQNDIDCGGGFEGGHRAWLSNFGCNPLEWFANFNVKFSKRYHQSLQRQTETLPEEIKSLQDKAAKLSASDENRQKIKTAIAKKQEVLNRAHAELKQWSSENFSRLSTKERSLHQRAFTINDGDPDYHELTALRYEDNGEQRELPVPKGDFLYQFRKDVESGNLPTVSWLAGAQNLSDHPSAPWYGSLYLSEILDILTQNPEVWKKTIFIVTFDENDGYFDHVPPFVAPDPKNPASGKCSDGIDTAVEYIYLEDELKEGLPKREARGGPIGLGFRVPMIVASPWSRGGQVCSQVFDHTSTLQFLEGFLEHKFGKKFPVDHISKWRRTVTGDLTAIFNPGQKEEKNDLPFLQKDPFIEKIYNAKFKKTPADFRPLTEAEKKLINESPAASGIMPQQEDGVRTACALPYELYAEGALSGDKKELTVKMSVGKNVFGDRSAGAPFNILFPRKMADGKRALDYVGSRSYAVIAGDDLTETIPVSSFEDNIYHVQIYGPNGFFRECKGQSSDPQINISCEYEPKKGLLKKLTGNVALKLANLDPSHDYTIQIVDHAYKNKAVTRKLKAGSEAHTVILELGRSHGWYDFSVTVSGFDHYERRYAGHVETGEQSVTDPAMGHVI